LPRSSKPDGTEALAVEHFRVKDDPASRVVTFRAVEYGLTCVFVLALLGT